MSETVRPAADSSLELLSSGDLEILGLLPYSSNYVFLARVCSKGAEALAVYKPRRGERPLWDFPRGTLAAREVAAFSVSKAAGWGIVPPTVMRPDAPMGLGSVQLFIQHDLVGVLLEGESHRSHAPLGLDGTLHGEGRISARHCRTNGVFLIYQDEQLSKPLSKRGHLLLLDEVGQGSPSALALQIERSSAGFAHVVGRKDVRGHLPCAHGITTIDGSAFNASTLGPSSETATTETEAGAMLMR